ncbi:MAG TPA: NAD-dependent epimerase/dehydratase family protein [Terriglobales bacterium]
MASDASTVLITGVAGNLGSSLVPLLRGDKIIGVDFQLPLVAPAYPFYQLDLGDESSCGKIASLLIETKVQSVVHLAFVLDPLRTAVLDHDRMWRINVAGTARVLEAIAEANRMGGNVAKFIHLSSVAVYGPNLAAPATEDTPLHARTLAYALHKKEADEVVRSRAEALGSCKVFVLRPHIFTGRSVQNYMVGALRGTAYGIGRLGRRLERKGSRLPLLLPYGKKYLGNKLQFIHIEDMARLITHIVKHSNPAERVTVLNVAGRGDPMTIAECARLANSEIKRFPTRMLSRAVIEMMWSLGVSSIPPDAFPYLVGSYTMDTTKLRKFLGPNYTEVIRHTNIDAFLDNLAGIPERARAAEKPQKTEKALTN